MDNTFHQFHIHCNCPKISMHLPQLWIFILSSFTIRLSKFCLKKHYPNLKPSHFPNETHHWKYQTIMWLVYFFQQILSFFWQKLEKTLSVKKWTKMVNLNDLDCLVCELKENMHDNLCNVMTYGFIFIYSSFDKGKRVGW